MNFQKNILYQFNLINFYWINMEGTTKQATKCDRLCCCFFSSSRSHLTKFCRNEKERDRLEKKKKPENWTNVSVQLRMKNDGKWRQWTEKATVEFCDQNKNLVTTQTKTETHTEFYRLAPNYTETCLYGVISKPMKHVLFLLCVYHKTTLP